VCLVRPVDLQLLSAGADGLGQHIEHSLGVFPADAGVRDRDTVLEAGLALWGNLLVACAGNQQ